MLRVDQTILVMVCDKRLKDLSTSDEELCQQLRTMISALSCSKNSLGAESVWESLGKSLGKGHSSNKQNTFCFKLVFVSTPGLPTGR